MLKELAYSVHEKLAFLESSDAMLSWVEENHAETENFVRFYDTNVYWINGVPQNNPLADLLPATVALTTSLKGVAIPTSANYQSFPGLLHVARGIRSSIDPMMLGQDIQMGRVAQTSDFTGYGIRTPSFATNVDALVFGTVGHLYERTFFSWAHSKGIVPYEGWKRDDLLHAVCEAQMVHTAVCGVPNEYFDQYFLKSTKEGGLGWVNPAKLERFCKKFWKIYS